MAVGVLRGDVYVRLGGNFVCNGGVLCFWSWVERGKCDDHTLRRSTTSEASRLNDMHALSIAPSMLVTLHWPPTEILLYFFLVSSGEGT